MDNRIYITMKEFATWVEIRFNIKDNNYINEELSRCYDNEDHLNWAYSAEEAEDILIESPDDQLYFWIKTYIQEVPDIKKNGEFYFSD